MLPIENSLAGLVPGHAGDPRGGRRLGRRRGRAAHPALPGRARPARRWTTMRVVHSHPMALAQCRNALNGRYERVAASTTSEAARTVAALDDVTVAAIASPLAARDARPRDPRRGDLRPSREPHALRLAGALHAARPRRPHGVAHRAPADHEARAGRAAQRHRAAALPRRADDLAALPADHGRALALPVLHRRGGAPLGRRACCARSRTSPSAAPSCTCSGRIPSAAECGERCRCGSAARAGSPRPRRAVVRPPERRPRAGHGARADPVPGRRPRLQLRRGRRPPALLEHRLVVPAAVARRVRRSHQRRAG